MSKPTGIVVGVGSEAGLGAALCRRFATEGHHVVIVGRTAERVGRLSDAIRQNGGSAEPITADVTYRTRLRAHVLTIAGTPAAGPHRLQYRRQPGHRVPFF